MSPELEERCGMLCESLQRYMDEERRVPISMTDATEAIWGTSGRGNPNAVLKIEALADLGCVRVTRVGGRMRKVQLTDRGIQLADRYRTTHDGHGRRV